MGKNDDYQRLFQLQYEMIDQLKAESMSLQFVLTGLLREMTQASEGKKTIRSAFDYALDQAIPHATSQNTPSGHYATTAVGMLEHWRKMLDV
jgi:hypothetical protein